MGTINISAGRDSLPGAAELARIKTVLLQHDGRPVAALVNFESYDQLTTALEDSPGAAIIGARGTSATNAASGHVYDWVNDTPEGDWTFAANMSDGSYRVHAGTVSSIPVTSKDGRCEMVHGLAIDDFSRSKIDASVRELVEERAIVHDLSLSR
jgi:malate dehydrogenase